MKTFFEPKSIAVIGVSRDIQKPGRVILRNILRNFRGKVYPVNPQVDKIEGLTCYPSILDIPDKVDLAVISIKAELVPETLEQCGKKKITSVVVISGGFKEVGRKDLEDQLREIVKKYGIRMIGPNCLGVFDNYTGVDTSFLPTFRMHPPSKGGISLISQSGAVGSTTVDWAAEQGLGISKMISYGNAADIDESDLIEYLSKDERTEVILVYIEGIDRGRRFMDAAKYAACQKPVIIVKAGSSESGAKAVASHTGSLAGSYQIYSAAFKQSGVLVAQSLEELLDFGKVLNMLHPARGGRVAVITCGGGFGVMATDAVEREGLQMSKLSEETMNTMKAQFPSYVVVHNPVDLIGDTDAERYRVALEAVSKDPDVDVILLILLFQVPRLDPEVVEIVLAAKQSGKPIVGVAAGSEFTKVHVTRLEEGGIPFYPTPERGVKAVRALVQYGNTLTKCPGGLPKYISKLVEK